MEYYIGCDVSMKALSLCVMEKSGKVVLRKDVSASPEALLMVIKPYLPHSLVGLEAGSTSNWQLPCLPCGKMEQHSSLQKRKSLLQWLGKEYAAYKKQCIMEHSSF